MMKLSIPLVLVAAALLFGSDVALAADSQPLSSVTGVTAKARTRAFNPFAVKKTRLKMNRLGMFVAVPEGELYDSAAIGKLTNVAPAASVIAPVSSVASAAAVAPVIVPTIAAPVAIETGTALTTATGTTVNSSESTDLSLATGAVRDPYRPPVRSPFRPPPRPPF